MSLPYLSPGQKEQFQRVVQLFVRGASSVKCVRSHFLPEKDGVCDLFGSKGHDEIFVIVNRLGTTLKVSKTGLEVVANFVDVEDTQQWFEHLSEQRRLYRERQEEESQRKEELRKASAKNVVIRKKSPNVVLNK